MLIYSGLCVLALGIQPKVAYMLHEYTITYFSFGDKVSLATLPVVQPVLELPTLSQSP